MLTTDAGIQMVIIGVMAHLIFSGILSLTAQLLKNIKTKIRLGLTFFYKSGDDEQ